MNSRTLTFSTYNCKHFKEQRIDYCKEVLHVSDVLFLQEHCLYENQFSDFNKLGDIGYTGVSSMDQNVQLVGRPYGGCAIIWKNSLNCKFKPVVCDTSRICAGILTFDGYYELLLINVYLPCDDRYRSGNYFDLVDTLSQISCIIGDCEVNSILLAGDFNCDFSRNSPHVAAVREFIAANDLFLCLNHPTSDVDYTFECKASGSFSLIDHFAVSK